LVPLERDTTGEHISQAGDEQRREKRVPKVSVLMPSFNYVRYLALAIESVLSQSFRDLELIITDDCSTDGSRETAEEWTRLDDRVVPVFHDVNHGLARARNSGLAVSSGEFVALCDADDIWLPDKLATQLECFRSRPEVGLVHSDSLIIDGYGNSTGQRFSSLFHRKGQVTSGHLFEELCQGNFLCAPTVILRRKAIEYAGGFDEDLRSLEDWVCWTKVSKKYPLHYVDAPLVQYRIHGSALSQNSKGMALNRVKALQSLFAAFPEISAQVKSRMLYALGMSHLELNEWGPAVAAFLNSIKTNAYQARSWVRIAQALCKLT
jgi:glycosyltransferase involved in cell wall biosynthesis